MRTDSIVCEVGRSCRRIALAALVLSIQAVERPSSKLLQLSVFRTEVCNVPSCFC